MHTPSRRPTRVAALLLLATLAFGGCGGSAVPTIPPITTPAAGDPTPVGGSEAPGTRIVAINIVFEPVAVTVAADQAFTIMFDNKDEGIPHDIVVRDASGNDVVRSEITTGPKLIQVSVPPLAAGAYPFVCTIHPNMVGTITAE